MIPYLQPGNYRISVEMSGFKPIVRSGMKLDVQQVARLDFVLEVGELSEQVNVIASTPLVQAATAEISNLVSGEQTRELPLNGRNFAQLLSLLPGTVGHTTFFTHLTNVSDRGFAKEVRTAVSGMRPNMNNWLVDGADNLDSASNNLLNTTPSVEAIAEFRVVQGNYSAEFGRNAGAQILRFRVVLPGQLADGRIIKVDDTFYLTYTAYDGVSARLCLATSKDLMNWQKKGPIISWDWSKSGAILSEKIGDRYIMYFGDSNIW